MDFAIRLVAFLLLPAMMFGCSRTPANVSVASKVNTITSGYPYALQVKDSILKDGTLVAVLVDLDQHTNYQFDLQRLTYAFKSPRQREHIFAVTVDNTMRQAFGLFDAPEIPNASHIPKFVFEPFEIRNATFDIPQILEIAKTNGLAQFCSLAPGSDGTIDLRLANSENGLVWNIIGDGWNEKGPIADLSIVISATNGAIISHVLNLATNRP